MISAEIEHLIIKYVNKSANLVDLNTLNHWIKDPVNQTIFKDYVKTHYAITISMNNPDPSEIRERLLKEIRKEKTIFYRRRFKSVLKYAAIAILFVGIGYFFQNDFFDKNPHEILVPKEEFITLELENGAIEIISEDGASTVIDSEGNVVGTQHGTQLVYNKEAAIEKLMYNTLTVPYGKRFDIVLSDGTRVFLNAGTSIKYPVKFLSGKDRHVFLNGEAFFDVSKDAEHPFIINANELHVRVLGTKFNVSNYPEDEQTEVVLVEGSVGLNPQNNTVGKENDIVLKPGFKGSFDKTQQTISTKKVNTVIYTSWVTGDIVFRNASFDKIIKKLERLYNVTIINNNEKLANENFNASIEVDNETIEEVLNYFNKVYQIEYEIVNNKIVIN